MGPPTPMPGAVLGARGEAGGPGQCWRVGDTGGGPGDGDGGQGITESLGAMLRGQGMMLGGQGPKAHQVSLPALEIQAAPKRHLSWGGGGGASSGKGDTHVSHPQT